MIDDLISHLQSTLASDFTTIDHAVDMEPVDDVMATTPALFVFPGKEVASPSGYDSFVGNECTINLHVYVVTSSDLLKTKRDALFTEALGFVGSHKNYGPLEYAAGEPVKIQKPYIWWLETFVTTLQRRQA